MRIGEDFSMTDARCTFARSETAGRDAEQTLRQTVALVLAQRSFATLASLSCGALATLIPLETHAQNVTIVSSARPAPPSLAMARTVSWDPAWLKFTVPEVVATSSLLLGTGAIILFGEQGTSNWKGPILFDEPVRDGLREKTASGRMTAQIIGDSAYYGLLAYPYLVDVLAVAWIGHRSPEVAGQMALMNTEAFAITGFLSFVSNATIRRERPYVRECITGQRDPGFPGCKPAGQSEGFYSGHTGIAFTGAALTCMHHANLPLYGQGGVGGVVACTTAMASASLGGVMRLLADKHYVSDVIAGTAIGLASGLLVPWFHYRYDRTGTRKASSLTWSPAPILSPTSAGIGAAGAF
jgi:PAP2 superfamily